MQKFEKKQIAKLISKKNIPTFRSGDTLRVTIKIVENDVVKFGRWLSESVHVGRPSPEQLFAWGTNAMYGFRVDLGRP